MITFCSSGNDLSATNGISRDDEVDLDIHGPVRALVAAFINFPKLLVCLVNGPAIGIAATTLALADIVYCHESAYIYTPFTALGRWQSIHYVLITFQLLRYLR